MGITTWVPGAQSHTGPSEEAQSPAGNPPLEKREPGALSLRTSSLLPCPVTMGTPGLESQAWETKTPGPKRKRFRSAAMEAPPLPHSEQATGLAFLWSRP